MTPIAILPSEGSSYGTIDSLAAEFAKIGRAFTKNPEKATVAFYDRHWDRGIYEESLMMHTLGRDIPLVVIDNNDYWSAPELVPERWGSDVMVPCVTKDWARDLPPFLKAGKDLICAYFMRKMSRSIDYPDYVKPIELTWDKNAPRDPVSAEALFTRPYDLCFIGTASNWRANFLFDLAKRFDLNIHCDFRHHQSRLSQADWMAVHSQAKMFIEADGGGFGSERPFQLMGIAPMLKQNNDQLIHEDFVDGVDCLKIGTPWGHVGDSDFVRVADLCQDAERLHQMYLNGIDRMNTHFTDEARAKYVLKTLEGLGIT